MFLHHVPPFAGLCFFAAVWALVRLVGGPTSGATDSDGGGSDESDCGGDGGCD